MEWGEGLGSKQGEREKMKKMEIGVSEWVSEWVCEAEREKESDKENGEKLTGMNEIGDKSGW